MKKRPITLGEFILYNENHFPYSNGHLSKIMSALKLATKLVSHKVNQAGLIDVTGAIGTENIQGEEQQKLDVIADDIFIEALKNRGIVCGIASEENTDFITFPSDECSDNPYVVLIDPLDGSSNIDVNVSVGTIFSVYHRISPIGTPVVLQDFLQKGNKQIMAGYTIYGSSTLFVYTTGNGVNGFTLDPNIGTFFLSHTNMRIPESGNVFSVNEGNYEGFNSSIKEYISFCKSVDNKQAYSARYIGSLVADVHRNILKGGIYFYPETIDKPNGKLRLLYECNPIAFIVEQAGGDALTLNGKRVMDITPDELHQRVPFYCGNKEMLHDLKL